MRLLNFFKSGYPELPPEISIQDLTRGFELINSLRESNRILFVGDKLITRDFYM